MGVDADDLIAFLAARDDAEGDVAPEMRSRVLAGDTGGGAYVLLHGLTASPPAWRALADALAERGATVVMPRLLLHGYADRMTRALQRLDAEPLVADVAAIVARVAFLGEPVTLVGHSLGATLAIDAALRLPGVARVVAVAPFLGIMGVPHEVHPLLLGVIAAVPNVFLWWDPVKRERLEPAHGYPRYPLRALATGIAIADAARASAHRPPHARGIDLVLNASESSVNNRTAGALAQGWRTSGASVAVHYLRGLGWSHDIIEPARSAAQSAHLTLLAIIAGPHVPGDRDWT